MAERNLLAELAQYLPPANLDVRSMPGSTRPMFSGGVQIAPNLEVQGSYFRPAPEAPADWRALLTYRRQF